MKLGLLLAKDLRLVVRNRALLVTLLVYPLLLVAVIGLAFADPEERLPVALVVSPEGNEPVEVGGTVFSLDSIEEDLGRFAEVVRTSDGDARAMLRNGEVDAVVLVPAGFLQDIVSINRSATLGILLDLSDPVKASIAENHIRGVLQVFNEALVEVKVDLVVTTLAIALEGGTLPSGDALLGMEQAIRHLQTVRLSANLSADEARRIDETIAFLDRTREGLEMSSDVIRSTAMPVRPEVSTVQSGQVAARDVVVPAALALSILWTGTLASSSLIVYERESQAARRLSVAPLPRGLVTLSKFLLTVAVVVAQSLVIVGVAKAAWNVRIDAPDLLLGAILASAAAALALGLLVSALVRDTNGATLLAVLLTFPMIFLSGLFFPVTFMPEAAQAIARFLPLTYSVEALRGTMLRDFTPAEATPPLAALGLFTLLAGAVGLWLAQRRFGTR